MTRKQPRPGPPAESRRKAPTVRANLRWAAEVDYLSKLTPEEREWLLEFTNAYYGNNFTGTFKKTSKKARREVYAEQNRARRDALNHNHGLTSSEGVPAVEEE